MSAELFPLVDVLTPNPGEAGAIVDRTVKGEKDAWIAAERLVDRGARGASVKLPDGGAVLLAADVREVVEPPPVRVVVDKTGAGDAFAGAFAVMMLEGRAPADCLRHAVAAASLAVTRYGAQTSYPDRDRLARAVATWRIDD